MLSSLELAKLCGVSQGTVDRALHGRPGISEKTKQKILDAARKHGYTPNPAALEIMRGQSSIVGAITPAFNSLFFSDLFECIQQELKKHGLKLVLAAAADPDEFLTALQDFAARRCRAAMVVPPVDDINIPATLTDRMAVLSFASPCRGANTHFLAPDEKLTGRRAVDYLYNRGHRKIAHVTYTRDACAIRDRAAGYEQQMKAHGLDPLLLRQKPDDNTINILRRAGITAVFTHNDWLAIALIRHAHQAGMQVPHDLSVLGVDDSPSFTSIFPDLTTMHYPFESLAAQACQQLLNPDDSERQKLSLEIVERTSVRTITAAARL